MSAGSASHDRDEPSSLFRCCRRRRRRERNRSIGVVVGCRQRRNVGTRGDAPAFLGGLQRARNSVLTETAHLTNPDTAVVDQSNADIARFFGDALMDLVAGKPRQLARVINDDDLGITALQTRECLVADREQLVVAAHRAGSTLTLRKRHGAAP